MKWEVKGKEKNGSNFDGGSVKTATPPHHFYKAVQKR
jgi:hypothetical protein